MRLKPSRIKRARALGFSIFSLVIGLSVFHESSEATEGSKDLALNVTQFQPDKSCVAWKASKRMFLVKSVEPVGVSCNVELKWNTQSRELVVEVPIDSFDSQEPERDAEVAKLLKATEHPSIQIATAAISAAEIEALRAKEAVTLKGRMSLAGQTLEKDFKVYRLSDELAHVVLQTSFSELNLQAPTVAGGVVAKVRDPLTLVAQLVLPAELR